MNICKHVAGVMRIKDAWWIQYSRSFTYSTAFKLDNDDLHGSLATYGGGGFVQSLSEDDSKESLESIAFLKVR